MTIHQRIVEELNRFKETSLIPQRLYIDTYLWFLLVRNHIESNYRLPVSSDRSEYLGLEVIEVLKKDFIRVEGDLPQ